MSEVAERILATVFYYSEQEGATRHARACIGYHLQRLYANLSLYFCQKCPVVKKIQRNIDTAANTLSSRPNILVRSEFHCSKKKKKNRRGLVVPSCYDVFYIDI